MHEWALAESILTAAVDAANKEKMKKIKEIKISIGELQQIEQEVFEFALKQIIADQPDKLKGVKIKIETEKSTLKCRACQSTWKFSDMKKKLEILDELYKQLLVIEDKFLQKLIQRGANVTMAD